MSFTLKPLLARMWQDAQWESQLSQEEMEDQGTVLGPETSDPSTARPRENGKILSHKLNTETSFT